MVPLGQETPGYALPKMRARLWLDCDIVAPLRSSYSIFGRKM